LSQRHFKVKGRHREKERIREEPPIIKKPRTTKGGVKI